jgi:hypothetical protein
MLVAKLKHATLAVTSPPAIYLCARARRSNMTRQPDARRMGRVSNVRQTCGALNGLRRTGYRQILARAQTWAGHSIWLPASTTALLTLVASVAAGTASSATMPISTNCGQTLPIERSDRGTGWSAGGIALTALCCARRRYALSPRRAGGTGIVPAPTSFLKEET